MHDSPACRLPSFPADCTLSNEFRLAAACSWIAPEPLRMLQDDRIAFLCNTGIDRDAFLGLVDRHGIPVQALTVLRRCLGDGMADRLYRELKNRGRRVAVRSTVQTAELVRLNRLLRGQGIEVIPLKGICLSQRLYGTPGVRSSGDLDILVRPEQFADADRLLTASGYRNIYNLTERQTAAFIAYGHHMVYRHEHCGGRLELHWRSRFWTSGEAEEFWRSRGTMAMMGESFSCLDDLILFLFLCDHGSRHTWFSLKWLGDMAMMLCDERMRDWERVLALADRLGFRRVVAQTALLVHWVYGLPLPLQVSELVSGEKTAPGLARKAVAALLAGADAHRTAGRRMERLRRVAYLKRTKPLLPFKLLLKDSYLCVTDYVTFPLPDRLFWMYVPLRPFFWFWRHYGGNFFARLRSRDKAAEQA